MLRAAVACGFSVTLAMATFLSAAVCQPAAEKPDYRTALLISSFRDCEAGKTCLTYYPAGYHGGKAAVSLVEAERDKQAVHCLCLTYDVTGAGNGEVADAQALANALELPGNVAAIRAEVLSDGSGNRVACVLVDRTGERFFYHLAELDAPGWITAEARLNSPEAHWDGNNNGIPEYPLRLGSIVVTARPGTRTPVGKVLVDKVWALCDFATEGVEAVCDLSDPKQPPWKIVGKSYDKADLAQAEDPENPDRKVVALGFGMKAVPGKEVYAGISADLGTALDGPGTILLDVYGDASRQILAFGATDAAGGSWFGCYPPLLVDWSGWRTVYLFSGGTTWRSASDEEAEHTGRYPLKLTQIVLAPPPAEFGPVKPSGRVLLRQLRFAPATPEVVATCRKAVTDVRDVPMSR